MPGPQTTVSPPPGEPGPHLPAQHPQLLWHKLGGALGCCVPACKQLEHQGLGLLPSTSQLLGSQPWSHRATACPQGVLPKPPFPIPRWDGAQVRSNRALALSLLLCSILQAPCPPPEPPSPFVGSREGVPQPPRAAPAVSRREPSTALTPPPRPCS